MVDVQIQERQILQHLNRIDALLERLPKNAQIDERFKVIKTAAWKFFEETKHIDAQTNWTSMTPASSVYTDLLGRSTQSSDNVDAFAAEALSYAKRIEESKDATYRRVSWASYVLYTLGWGLGLVGTLSGSKDEDPILQE